MLLALLRAGEAVVFLGRECVDPGAGAGAGDSDLRMVILRSTCRPLSLTHATLNTRHFIHRHTQGVKRLSLGCGETHLLGLGKPELTLLMGFAA